MVRCIRCKQKAIINVRQPLCDRHFIEFFTKTVEQSIKKHKMFSKRERILVAVSGGKDSLSLVHVLNKLGYNFDGLYIDLGIDKFSDSNKKNVEMLFSEINKDLHIIRLSEYGIKIKRIRRSPPCYVCGVVKRYLQNKFSIENNYDVIATGHNLTDEASFYLMNLYSGQVDYILKYAPVLPKAIKFSKKVKPLYKLTEKETMCYSILNNIPISKVKCPYAKDSTQIKWKNILYSIENKILKFSINFVSSIRKLAKFAPKDKSKKEINFCKNCGYPTSLKNICTFCKLREYFKSQ